MSNIFGAKLRSVREEKNIPQRLIANALEIDTATYCKIEKGDRRVKREQMSILADFFDIDEKELTRLWSADKIYEILSTEDDASEILNIVCDNIIHYKSKSVEV